MSFFDVSLPWDPTPFEVIELAGVHNGQRLRISGDSSTSQTDFFIVSGEKVTGPFRPGKQVELDINWLDARRGCRASLLVVNRQPVAGHVNCSETCYMDVDGLSIPAVVNMSINYTFSVEDGKSLAEAFAACQVSDPVLDAEGVVLCSAKAELRKALLDLESLTLAGLNSIPDTVEHALSYAISGHIPGCRISYIQVQVDFENVDDLMAAYNRRILDTEKKSDMLFNALLAHYNNANNIPQQIVQMATAYLTANPGASPDDISRVLGKFDEICLRFGSDRALREVTRQVGQLGPNRP